MSSGPTPREAMRDLWLAIVEATRLEDLLRWMDGQLRRFPRLYGWLSR